MTTLDDALPLSHVEGAVSPRDGSFRMPWRALKLGFGTTLLFVGFYGVLSAQHFISSDAAVVTTYTTALRSPIDGQLQVVVQSAGSRVAAGALVARIVNERVDEQHLENLREAFVTTSSAGAGEAAEQATLRAERRNLLARSEAHTEAVVLRMDGQAAVEERRVASRTAAWQQAQAELRRGELLLADGIVSRAEFEREQAAEREAREELAAEQQAWQVVRGEKEAARRGLLTEAGVNNDVAYSRQRADEIEMRLADGERRIAQSRAETAALQAMLTEEQQRDQLMRSAELRAPADRVVWRLDASNGEHVAAGDTIAELVDCNSPLLEVAIPQSRVPDLLMGGVAHIRLSGEQAVRSGQVMAVLGDPKDGNNRKLAAAPLKNSEERMATIEVALDPHSGSTCDIGRAASVQLPTAPSALITRLLRRYL